MQDPNADTEWNDILRKHNILPPKPVEPEEPEPVVIDKAERLDQLGIDDITKQFEIAEDAADDEEAQFLNEYRRKRMAAMMEESARAKYGDVREVSKADWKSEVNDARDVYTVIHIATKGHELCSLIDQNLRVLAAKFPAVKFLRGESSLCIDNYPQANLPTLLIYHDGQPSGQIVGPKEFSGKASSLEGLEWRLSQLGVLRSSLSSDPSKEFNVSLGNGKSASNRINGRGGRRNSPESSDSDDY